MKLFEKFNWFGYRRKNNKFGIRNYNIVLSTVALTDRISQEISEGFISVRCVVGEFNRGLQKKDEKILNSFFKQVLSHPNVGSALIITHDNFSLDYFKKNFKIEIPHDYLSFMSCSGRDDAIKIGKRKVKELIKSSKLKKVKIPFSELILALECGGSDVSSSICSNPLIGDFTDLLIKEGGTAIVSETAEFIGAEQIFDKRCKNKKIKQLILEAIKNKENLMQLDSGKDYRGTNPTNENIEGGLTTLIEKSMGAVSKTGTTKFVSALNFGEIPKISGLHFMDTPFFSPISLTGMMMGGCTLSLFAMGVYNPSGNILCPTIKLCGNPNTLKFWSNDIDIDVSDYFLGVKKSEEMLEKMMMKINLICNGNETVAETNLEGQFILPRYEEVL